LFVCNIARGEQKWTLYFSACFDARNRIFFLNHHKSTIFKIAATMQFFSRNKAVILLLLVFSAPLTLFTSVDALVQDCDAQGQDIGFFFSFAGGETGPCDEVVAGACPSTCNEAIDSFHATCSMEGATYQGDPYKASTALVSFSLLKGDDACKGIILDKALEFADTCQEWATLNLGAVLFECSGDADVECPQFCTAMLDGFYGTCSSKSTYVSTDSDSGVSETLSVNGAAVGLGLFLSNKCGTYQDTKAFTGTDKTSAGATIPLFATAVFVTFASVAISL